MSSERITTLSRRAALFGIIAAVAGCGFRPVYGPDGAGPLLQNAVRFTAPDTVAGFRLRERLTERLGHSADTRYDLQVTLGAQQGPATITPSGDTARFNLAGKADWTLTHIASGRALSGEVQTFTSYSATGSTVATQAAESDARDRLSVALADLIVARLLIAAPGLQS